VGVPPAQRLPADTWRLRVHVSDIGDLTDPATLATHGIRELRPTRRQWPRTQLIGEAYYREGYRGILTPSAAHAPGRVLTIFRPLPKVPGVRAVPPPNHYTELPPLPTGLRT